MVIVKTLWTLLLAAILAALAALPGCASDTAPGMATSVDFMLPGTHFKAAFKLIPPSATAPALVTPATAIPPVVVPAEK